MGDFDWTAKSVPKICKHCGKPKGNHKAVTLACPVGERTRVGYTSFSEVQTFELKP